MPTPDEVTAACERWAAHRAARGTSGPYWVLIESDQDYEGWDREQMKRDAERLAGDYPRLLAERDELRDELDCTLADEQTAHAETSRLWEECKVERDRLLAENERLRLRVLTAAGDDLCRLTQEEIKELSSGAVQIPPESEFLASCKRFHAQIADTSGVLEGCLTLAQMVAENERLAEQLADYEAALKAIARPALGGKMQQYAAQDILRRPGLQGDAVMCPNCNTELHKIVELVWWCPTCGVCQEDDAEYCAASVRVPTQARTYAALRKAVMFGRSRFCDPAACNSDPASKVFKELSDAALDAKEMPADPQGE